MTCLPRINAPLRAPKAMHRSVAGGMAVGLAVLFLTHNALAQTGERNAPTGINAIPTDLPAHASSRPTKTPVSLLPGTIPDMGMGKTVENPPSLADQYRQRVLGIEPAEKHPRKTSDPQESRARKERAKPAIIPAQPASAPPARAVNATARTMSIPPQEAQKQMPSKQDFLKQNFPQQDHPKQDHPKQAVKERPSQKTGNQIQLGVFHDVLTAETYWASFKIRYPNLAKDHPRNLETSTLGHQGTYLRLRLDGFATPQSAQEKCRQLLADGTDCFATQ